MEAMHADKRAEKFGRDPTLLFRKVMLPALIRSAQIDATMGSAGVAPMSRDRTGYDDAGQFSGFTPPPQIHVGGAPMQALRRARSR